MKFASQEDILNLITYILKVAYDYGCTAISKTQLIKFLYLADLIFARLYEGQTWTGWKWRYYHFGPYCEEAVNSIQEAVNRGLILSEKLANEKKEFMILKPTPKALEQKTEIPIEFHGLLPKWIKKYGGDLCQLLDFVYQNTEPMIEAKKGELLNFSSCLPSSKIAFYSKEFNLPRMSEEKRNLLKSKIKKLTKLRLAREKEQRKKENLPPGISPSEMLTLLKKFDEWCEQS